MYQVPTAKFSGSQALKTENEQKPTNQTVFYNPLGQSPPFPSCKSPNPNSQSVLHVGKNPSEKTNVSGNASTEYSTPRMIVSTGLHEDQPKNSQTKAIPQVKLTHLFGAGARNPSNPGQNYSFLSNASSHDSEENQNLLKMNTSFSYHANPSDSKQQNIAKLFCFPQINNQNNGVFQAEDSRVKSLHLSSKNHNKKIEEQEEKDDEDFILNISKYYINNVEEDPSEILQAFKAKEERGKEDRAFPLPPGMNIPNNLKPKLPLLSSPNMVFEIMSRNRLEFPRRKKNFPEANSAKYDLDLDNVNKN